MHSPFEASPLSPGATLRTTLNLYRRHWRVWLGLSLLTYVPLVLITQLTNIAPELGDSAPWGWLLVTLAFCFQALVMNGAGAIFVADGLRGERPTVWYALDLLFTQRLGRVFLMWLLVTILTDVLSLPLLPLTLLGFLPYATAIALVDALPWIAGIGLLLAAVVLLAVHRQRYFPLLLAVAFVVIYSLVVIHAPDQSRDVQRILILFSQGMRLLLNALFLLLVPIVALDPGPLWRTAARGWQIAKQNLPLIFVTLFVIGLATGLLENLVAGARLPAARSAHAEPNRFPGSVAGRVKLRERPDLLPPAQPDLRRRRVHPAPGHLRDGGHPGWVLAVRCGR